MISLREVRQRRPYTALGHLSWAQLVPQSRSWEPGERKGRGRGGEGKGSWGSAELQGTPRLWGRGASCSYSPSSWVRLASSQTPPEDIGAGWEGETLVRPELGEGGVLVLVSLSQAA